MFCFAFNLFSAMSHVGMELRDETLFVFKRVGMILVWHQPVSVHI